MDNRPVAVNDKMRYVCNRKTLARAAGVECLEYKTILVNGLVPDSLTVDIENLLVCRNRCYFLEAVVLDFANGTIVQ